jgi:hypothetical protein
MHSFETRLERLELKYLVDEGTAERVRRDITPYCAPDIHNPTGGGMRGYGISSLYLDSPALAFHQAKERGDPDRLKLRVRRYDRSAIRVLEIKRRVSDVISKTRAAVDAAEAELAVSGGIPQGDDPRECRFFEDFALAVAQYGARPALHVHYEREAYASAVDDYARVTLDRNISVQRADPASLESRAEEWLPFRRFWEREEREHTVVLELKCQAASVPWWISELVRTHALARTSFSKYSVGIYISGKVAGHYEIARRSARVMQ